MEKNKAPEIILHINRCTCSKRFKKENTQQSYYLIEIVTVQKNEISSGGDAIKAWQSWATGVSIIWKNHLNYRENEWSDGGSIWQPVVKVSPPSDLLTGLTRHCRGQDKFEQEIWGWPGAPLYVGLCSIFIPWPMSHILRTFPTFWLTIVFKVKPLQDRRFLKSDFYPRLWQEQGRQSSRGYFNAHMVQCRLTSDCHYCLHL